MTKKIFLISIVAILISSCSNSIKKEATAKPEGSSEAVKVEFASLMSDPTAFVGKNISVEGKVVHVCTMSGKKMFITGENPDVRLYVQAGEEMPKFPMELLGSEVVVEGKLTALTQTGAEGGGEMHHGEGMTNTSGADTCETEKAMAKQTVLADLMMVYNKHTVVK